MHLPRPTTPRREPIPKVAERDREAMENSFANAVNVIATIAHSRPISKAFGDFAQTILFKGDLSRRDVEIAVLRMGWNCQSVYEFGQHTLMARAQVMNDEEIYLTTRPIAEGNWTAAEAAVSQVFRVESSRPPGVSKRTIRTSAFCSPAVSMARARKRAEVGCMMPSISMTAAWSPCARAMPMEWEAIAPPNPSRIRARARARITATTGTGPAYSTRALRRLSICRSVSPAERA